MELRYIQTGDYYIPDIKLSHTSEKPLGKYGRMRRAYLKENRPVLYSTLVLSEQLFPHLWEIQQTCEERMEHIMTGLLEHHPAPDKATHQMEWVGHMNMLKAQAEEIILRELIHEEDAV